MEVTQMYWIGASVVVGAIFFIASSYLFRKNQTNKILDSIEDVYSSIYEFKRETYHKFELLDKTLDRLIERDMEIRIEKRLLDVTPLLENKPRRGRPKKEIRSDALK